jgi:hypothetical protein
VSVRKLEKTAYEDVGLDTSLVGMRRVLLGVAEGLGPGLLAFRHQQATIIFIFIFNPQQQTAAEPPQNNHLYLLPLLLLSA